MTISASFNQSTGVLAVLGDDLNNLIIVGRNTAGDMLVNLGAVSIKGGKATAANVSKITIDGKGGNDHLSIDEANGGMPAGIFRGGAGNDTLIGGSGADQFFGGTGNDIVDGNSGIDIVSLGTGDDTFRWDFLDGNDVLDGQEGSDRLIINGSNSSEAIALSVVNNHLQMVRNSGTDSNTLDTNSFEQLDLNVLDGADTITINDLSTSSLHDLNLSLESLVDSGKGDGKSDSLTLIGTNNDQVIEIAGSNHSYAVTGGLPIAVRVKGSEANDILTLKTLGGNDSISAAPLAAFTVQLTVDGGSGNDRIVGSFGSDILIGGDGNDSINGGAGNDTVFLGAGDDIFEWTFVDGNDVVEGQTGKDTLRFNGSNINENIDVSAKGNRVRLFRDIANIVLDINGIDQLDLNPAGGSDTVTVNDLTGTDLRQVNINLAAPNSTVGDSQLDRILINGTNGNDKITATSATDGNITVAGLAATVTITKAERADQLGIIGLAGDDVLDATKLAANAIALSLIGGNGNDVLNGSAGSDFISGGAGNDVVMAGAGDDFVLGDDGDDLLDGGAGNDALNGGLGVDILLNGETVSN